MNRQDYKMRGWYLGVPRVSGDEPDWMDWQDDGAGVFPA